MALGTIKYQVGFAAYEIVNYFQIVVEDLYCVCLHNIELVYHAFEDLENLVRCLANHNFRLIFQVLVAGSVAECLNLMQYSLLGVDLFNASRFAELGLPLLQESQD